jgi:hypothetical protein
LCNIIARFDEILSGMIATLATNKSSFLKKKTVERERTPASSPISCDSKILPFSHENPVFEIIAGK